MEGILIGGPAHGTVRPFRPGQTVPQYCEVLMHDPRLPCDDESYWRYYAATPVGERESFGTLHLRYAFLGIVDGETYYYGLP
jgi:hypothetical protein